VNSPSVPAPAPPQEKARTITLTRKEYKLQTPDIDLFYPEVSGLSEELGKQINQTITDTLHKAYPDQVYKHAKLDYRISYQNEQLLNIVWDGTADFGGARAGIEAGYSLVISLNSGETYSQQDLFLPDYASKLKKLMRKDAESQLKEAQAEYLITQFDSLDISKYEWSLEPNGIMLAFVLHPALGVMKAHVTYEQLDSIVNKNGQLWKELQNHHLAGGQTT
jgi:hypothetical protein